MPTAAGSLDTETATSSTGGVAGRQLAIEIETIERRVCATRRDLFVPVTVDPRPSRAVHCPDLNACLVNETRTGREQQVDCQAIHFGYAIPVNVVPLETDPRLAELVLDHSTELSRRAASFLLEHHPQLRQQQRPTQQERCPSMAATAKHDLRQKFPTETSTSTSGDEDIAAIAKQISDHAEAIYQTWKSRGLAPTEILNCHSNATAADKFGTALTPTSTSNSPNSTGKVTPTATSPTNAVDILSQTPSLDNGNLEKLVNNFVVEDKARLAASRQRSPSKTLPSSIQFALENNQIGNQVIKAKQGNVLLSPTSPFATKPSQIVKPQVSTKTPGAHHREVLLETIETTFPADLTPSKIVVQQKRPASTVITSPTASNHDDSPTNSGLTTWPLKNKLNDGKRATDPCRSTQQEIAKLLANKEEKRNSSSNSSVYLDEVAREEERLINALKTGSVITEEPAERTVLSLTRQKPAIKREKPKVEPVKPIIIGHNHHAAGLVATSAAVVNSVVSPTPGGGNAGSVTSDTKSLSKDDLSNMSVVDYAKVRYRAAQQNPPTQQRLEEQRTNNSFNSTEQLVSTTRSKFETEIQKDKEASREEKDSVTSRWGPRINSPRPRIEQVPHPELTTQQKQHIRAAAATGTGNNPIRPFLTRGSVAERVLIFEKCPSELLLDKRGPRQPAINTWRTGHDVQNKAQTYAKDKTQQKSLPPHTTLQRHVKANRNHVHIPRFYFPGGKPLPLSQVEATVARITAAFQTLPGHRASRAQFHTITKACDLSLYWKVPLFLAAGGDQTGYVEMNAFLEFWKEMSNSHHDAASKFIRITTRGQRNNILPEDLIPLVQDVVETHPGLTFLKEATEFHSRYVHTVIARIFYCVNRSWSGRISVAELRRSNLLSVIAILEYEEDINQVTAYFSYEHFYVIYCKFWELDRDHDLFIDKTDLTKHNDHALSKRMIARIFSGAVTRGGVKSGNGVQQPQDKMSYTEFVWFLLSEEDKNHPTAIEYWFRCMDLDGDGYLSMYELEYFYEEQLHRMEAIGLETLPFEDCLCQMLDMIKPAKPGKISLSDLKKCKMTSIFFDTFFNLEKYLDHEQRDPFASAREHDPDGHELSDWDRFAAEEYELLVTEESGNEQNEQMSNDSMSEDTFSQNLETLDSESVDMLQGADVQFQGYTDLPTIGPSDSIQSRNQYYDSGDSDDYAESDN
ncbi:Serine/threonine-protein phosphatase 2A regulatory subunit B'' subunit alpha [Melipona quadrifasciata]|uniref:Serine/threonine-protein phosphatase 2A regulatory subunit B'' subunit alpha n=1 Tax=Melipona quadrifasciata TaxID=166423 RepID=A0A0M9A869_9HYME|nr:Serine/threonine-protein phosphatase 2A regulatory subunit B'' subunit alpha [Melipona quadrifasciata]